MTSNTTRFRVLDINDRLCGVWYARTAVEAIQKAIDAGYDAWAVSEPGAGGW